jgi:lipid-A-disaccharide synthase
MTRVLLSALEPSADALAAGILAEAARRGAAWESLGVAGLQAREAGFGGDSEPRRYAVMGLAQALLKLPSFLALRRRLLALAEETRPDVFVGIDAPDFHLPLARELRQRGVLTVQYVSPTVWAWREERIEDTAAAVDLVLCLFPFEPRYYEHRGVRARYVGHPLADRLRPAADRTALRRGLGWSDETPWVVLAPGSRRQELAHHAPVFFAAAAAVHRRTGARFVLAVPPGGRAGHLPNVARRQGLPFSALEVREDARTLLAAADAALVKSGTITLEATLVGCPCVVAYRTARLNASFILARGFRTPYIALPNILAGRPVVPEYIQNLVRPGILAGALSSLLLPGVNEPVRRTLVELGEPLRTDADARAYEAVVELLAERSGGR